MLREARRELRWKERGKVCVLLIAAPPACKYTYVRVLQYSQDERDLRVCNYICRSCFCCCSGRLCCLRAVRNANEYEAERVLVLQRAHRRWRDLYTSSVSLAPSVYGNECERDRHKGESGGWYSSEQRRGSCRVSWGQDGWGERRVKPEVRYVVYTSYSLPRHHDGAEARMCVFYVSSICKDARFSSITNRGTLSCYCFLFFFVALRSTVMPWLNFREIIIAFLDRFTDKNCFVMTYCDSRSHARKEINWFTYLDVISPPLLLIDLLNSSLKL